MSYQYPLLRPLSLRNRDNARLAAAVGIALENMGSHDHGPIRANLKVAVQTSATHSNHRHTPSNQVDSHILMDLREKEMEVNFCLLCEAAYASTPVWSTAEWLEHLVM